MGSRGAQHYRADGHYTLGTPQTLCFPLLPLWAQEVNTTSPGFNHPGMDILTMHHKVRPHDGSLTFNKAGSLSISPLCNVLGQLVHE